MIYFLQIRSKLYPEGYKSVRKMFTNTKFENIYEAYLPKDAKKGDPEQPATALESKPKDPKKPQPESKTPAQ